MTRPPLEVLKFVKVPEPVHLKLILDLCRSYWYEQKIEDYGRDWYRGDLWIWALNDDSAVILTRTVKRGQHEYLWVEGIVGAGMIAKRDAIVRDLKVIAKEYHCAGILGNAIRPGLEKLYTAMGAKKVSVQFLMEI